MLLSWASLRPPPRPLGKLREPYGLFRPAVPLVLIGLMTGCGSMTVEPSAEPNLSVSRQQEQPPQSPVLASLQSPEWAQTHGLPVNPHRGNGASITFFGPGGSIRRHIVLSEAQLRPASRVRTASYTSSAARPINLVGVRDAPLPLRQGELTDSIVVIGSTEQLWVFEDGVLITKTILIIDADTIIGGSQLAFDELGEATAEQWVPRSLMGAIDDPEDPQWEMSYPLSPVPGGMRAILASCELHASSENCPDAIVRAVAAGVVAAASGALCAKLAMIPGTCWLARNRGKYFAAMVVVAIAVCAYEEWETGSPALRDPLRERYPAGAGKLGPLRLSPTA